MTPSLDLLAQTYDDVPYLSACYPQSAPENLRALAHLYGLPSVPPDRARVLEIGCAAGGNLLPFASRWPEAKIVGVDLSAVQIRHGQQAIEALGLTNITLRQGDIATIGASLGTFDYIVCHGVYSWVPDDVRDAILRLTRACLSEQGVAYISYNTYPGWKSKEIVRDAMRFHAAGRPHREQLPHARAMIDFLQQMTPADSPVRHSIDAAAQTIRDQHAQYLLHEYLEPFNQPCYFTDFAAAAGRHDLAYLGEATLRPMFAAQVVPQAAGALEREYGDARGDARIALEQTIDFLRNREFRQTLLVRREAAESVHYDLPFDAIASLHVASRLKPRDGEAQQWQDRSGAHVRAADPVTRKIIAMLNEAWPATVPVQTLLDAASHDFADREDGRARAAALIRDLLIASALLFRVDPVTETPAPHPLANAALRKLVQLQEQGELPIALFNAWNEPFVELGAVEKVLLPLLDGQHDINALHDAVREATRAGKLYFQRNGLTLTDDAAIEKTIVENTGRALDKLIENALAISAGHAREH